jgi:5-methylcytosine-specific restriction protein B
MAATHRPKVGTQPNAGDEEVGFSRVWQKPRLGFDERRDRSRSHISTMPADPRRPPLKHRREPRPSSVHERCWGLRACLSAGTLAAMASREGLSVDAVSAAMDEFDRLGREAFLEKYGFGRAKTWVLLRDGNQYDSKAIFGVAYGIAHPNEGPLSSADFKGGEMSVVRDLERLGFEAKRLGNSDSAEADRDGLLFFFTAANRAAREHLGVSMRQGIPLEALQPLEDVYPSLVPHSHDGRVFAWGARPGSAAEKKWERLSPGDIALVYSDGRFVMWGQVCASGKSEEVARRVWGEDENGEVWACMMFFDPVQEIDVSRRNVFEALGYKETYVPQGFEIPSETSQARIVDEYGSAEAFVKSISEARDQRSVWWVNQGASFRRASEGGYLWAPKVDRQGRGRRDWDALTEVRPGDVVLNYADGKIRGVSSVERQAYDSSRPAPEDAASWENDGRRLDVVFRALADPIALADIPVDWRVAEPNGPFDRNGRVKQGYLFALSDDFTTRMVQRFPELGLSRDGGAPITPLPDLAAIWQSFNTALRDCGLTFGENQDLFIRAFLTALATKPFVILTGLSGSGKTQLAIKLGQWLGPGRWHIEPVRPDWTGAEALFGYEDALQPSVKGRRAWQVPNALEFILRAAQDPIRPYLLILDEMNLAHVERYFADVLSGMESREPCLPNLWHGTDGTWRLAPPPGPQRIEFPRNLFVAGTVNVDETTYMFSPKVLDRANTLEFRVSTDALDVAARRPGEVDAGRPDLVAGLLALTRDDNWHLRNPAPNRDEVVAQLLQLHRLLSEGGFEFGHRVFYEAIRFAALLAAAGEPSPEVALDLQILQKILPRLHGARRRLESTLHGLAKFCFSLDTQPGDVSGGPGVFDPLNPPEGEGRLPLSFEKVQRMTRVLQANQFASFTD